MEYYVLISLGCLLSFEAIAEQTWKKGSFYSPSFVRQFRFIYSLLLLTCGICGFAILILAALKIGILVALPLWLAGGILAFLIKRIPIVNVIITSAIAPPIITAELIWGVSYFIRLGTTS